jgi:hypothetical protein
VRLAKLGGADVAALLDSIPGANERIEQGIQEAREGRTIPLDDP